MDIKYFRVILFLLSVSMATWLSIKEFKKVNSGIFIIAGVVFVGLSAYLTDGFDLKDDSENQKMGLEQHPLENESEEEKIHGIKVSRIKNVQEINPDFQEAEEMNQVYQFYRQKDYPMLDQEHRNADDCTIDGSCIIKPSGEQILTENDKKSILEGFELTGTAIQNDDDDLYNYNMKTIDMILPINAPYDQEPDQRTNRMNDLCHNCKVGVCHHGICHSI